MQFTIRRLAAAVALLATSAFVIRIGFFDGSRPLNSDLEAIFLLLSPWIAVIRCGAGFGVLFGKRAWLGAIIGAVIAIAPSLLYVGWLSYL